MALVICKNNDLKGCDVCKKQKQLTGKSDQVFRVAVSNIKDIKEYHKAVQATVSASSGIKEHYKVLWATVAVLSDIEDMTKVHKVNLQH